MIARALAAMGDKSTVTWATSQLSQNVAERWVAIYIIAKSPLPAAGRLARKIIRRGGAAEVGEAAAAPVPTDTDNAIYRDGTPEIPFARISNRGDAELQSWLRGKEQR